eukprot:9356017-Alexandrium_andersonii.AAC.1
MVLLLESEARQPLPIGTSPLLAHLVRALPNGLLRFAQLALKLFDARHGPLQLLRATRDLLSLIHI